jgi:SNF2 family DNA or RNA helicase
MNASPDKLRKRLSKRIKKWHSEWCRQTGLDQLPHQLRALEWAAAIEAGIGESAKLTTRGGVLADEMGLGKTMVALALMLLHPKPRQLIVVPRMLLAQWRDIIKERLGHTALVFHGAAARNITQEILADAPIVITTYGMIAERKRPTTTSLLLAKQKWGRVVFDEAHHMRNRNYNFTGAACLKTEKLWLLTGTPIQNSRRDLQALWMLLGFSAAQFGQHGFERRLIENLVLHRTKKSVGISTLEPKIEEIECDWDNQGEQDLSDQFHSTLQCMLTKRLGTVRPSVSAFSRNTLCALVRCRQMCVAAGLLLDDLKGLESKWLAQAPNQTTLPPPLPFLRQGSKIGIVCDHLQKGLASKQEELRRKLVFCHYIGSMDMIEQGLLEGAGRHTVARISGKTTQRQRKQILDSLPDVLLLQIRTGCEGLNLQEYSDVYFVTPHWNPAVEEQAIGRCHRIGQTKRVRVFRFVMNNTGSDGISLDELCTRTQGRKLEEAKIVPIKS